MTRQKESRNGATDGSAARKVRLLHQRESDAREAREEANKLQKAEAAKTARLKELRLAKEANDRVVAERTKVEKPKASAGLRRRSV